MRSLALLVLVLLPAACAVSGAGGSRHLPAADSDPRAVTVAREVIRELGGPEAWKQARVLEWNFFGRRAHCWDTWSGDYRLDDGAKTVLMNLNTGEGRVFDGRTEVTDPEAVKKELSRARSVWINDSYWLLMPWKLLDPGVTLALAGERQLPDGRAADVLVLTFEGVGDTPRNKYEVLVAKDTRRVESWTFWTDRSDAEPKFTTPWTGWKRYGPILLSGDRGPQRQLTEIAVLDAPPAKLRAP